MVDGPGPLPDSWAEVLTLVFVGFGVVLVFGFYTGLDAQVAYAVGSPGQYFVSNTSSDTESLALSSEQVGDINFASKNRIGVASMGDEIGLCGGVRNSGKVFNLRLAEGFEETSRTGVTFSCVEPRSVVMHSQPDYSSRLSPEDRSFDGEFQPQYSCIVYGELAVSPVSGEVGGINCWSVRSGGEFSRVSVVLQG